MFLPPGEIKIKRKRTDEPVELLHIQESRSKKIKCASDYVFCRQSTSQTTKTTHSTPPSSSLPFEYSCQNPLESPKIKSTTIPRHFHLCRSAPTSEANPSVTHLNRKRKAEAVFVERKSRLVCKSNLRDHLDSSTVMQSLPKSTKNNTLQKKKTPEIAAPCYTPTTDSSILLSQNYGSIPSYSKKSLDLTSQDLIAKMQAYTLSEIAKNIAASEEERYSNKQILHKSTAPTHSMRPQPSRFKPKVSVQRYKDREENKLDLNTETNLENEYFEEVEGDKEDWVIETYLRMPLENAETEKCSNFGFLVLESETEIEEFYHIDTDSEEEDYEDEDENAENHYSADYPDEEVASDDEFDRNAYYYAKDIDEFDDDALSDDEIGLKKSYPWNLSSRKKIGHNQYVDDEEESD